MEQNRENKLGTQPIPGLLASMAIPLIAANIITALYNIVDGIYVARLSETALTATTLAFPAQMLMQSVASGTAGGVNSLLSRRLGAKDFTAANDTARHGLVLAGISYLVFLLLGITLSGSFIGLFSGAGELRSLGTEYLLICLCGSGGVFFGYYFHALLEATGRTGYCLLMQGAGSLLNVLLDPILIFGLFGFPKMGIAGAALATVLSQMVSALLGLVFNLAKNRDVQLSWKGFRFRREILSEIYKVGVPSMLMMSIGSLMDVGMNKILIAVSHTAVSVFGVYYKLQSFVFMPVFGISQGLVPIVGYNYGAKRVPRMKQAIRVALVAALIVMALGTALFQLAPRTLLGWFSASEEMYAIGVRALRICSLGFVISAVCIMLGDTLMGMGIGYVSAINSFLRQIVILLPLAYLLERQFGVGSVWYAFVASELMSLSFTAIMFVRLWRRKVRPIEDGTASAA